MTANAMDDQTACLQLITAMAKIDGDLSPQEFEQYLAALRTFGSLPVGVTPEGLLEKSVDVNAALSQVQSPDLQQQVYRWAYAIARFKGINPEELALLEQIRTQFKLSPAAIAAIEAEAVKTVDHPPRLLNSCLDGMAAMIRRENDVRRTVFDYSLAAAIVGLVPISGGGTLELKIVVVALIILKMMWDIRKLWGAPKGQDFLAIAGNLLGGIGAIVAGLLAWGTVVALGVLIPFASSFAKAAGFATTTWVVGQSTNQFYTSLRRPDPNALKRAFPHLLVSED